MTPQIKTIILSNGEVLSDQGVVKAPKKGEWFIDIDSWAGPASFDHDASKPATILTPLETQGQKIERRGNYRFTRSHTTEHGGSVGAGPLNPLIDLACAVVNDADRDSGFGPEYAIVKSCHVDAFAAELATFTQPVKPKDRYYVGDDYCVYDRTWVTTGAVASFNNEQDAKDFAAMKNSQDGGE